MFPASIQKSDLIRILQGRAAEFLTKARTVTDKLRADEPNISPALTAPKPPASRTKA